MPYVTEGKFDDPRPELKKLRRGTLKRMCRDNGLDFNESVQGADDLRRLVQSNNIDITPYIGNSHKIGKREAASQAIERVTKENSALQAQIDGLEAKFMALLGAKASENVEAVESKAIEEGEFPTSFAEEDKTPIWRLRQYAKIAGIEFDKTNKAVDLIRKLNEYITERR